MNQYRLMTFHRLSSLLTLCCLCFVASTGIGSAQNSAPLRFQLPAVNAGSVHVPAHEYVLDRVSPEHYLKNVILVKTKSSQHPDASSLSFQSTAWEQTLSPLAVTSIRAPFSTQQSGNAIQQVDPIGLERIFELHYALDIDAYDACALIAQNPDVEYAVPVFRRTFFGTPNDAQFSSQYAMAKIKASQAWDISTGSSTVVIADVDSGVDFEHEDLAANQWLNPGEIGTDSQGRDKRTNGVDDDKDGYIDDYRGWDFVGSITTVQAMQGTLKPDNDPKVRNANMDAELNHGTMTTGCAAAVTNNSKGVAGVGYNCKYLAIKCGSDQFGNAVLAGYEGIRYAAMLGAKVINCSWGGAGSSQAEQDVINFAVSKGALVVVAAGNNNLNLADSLQYPANFDNVLTVGATDANDKKAGFSNYGQRVDVWAPGVGILSTQSPNKYGAMDGTSFSCPIVAGLAGLIISKHPDWTPKMVAEQIRSTCDNVITTNQSQRPLYYGRVNAYRALSENADLNTGTTPGLELTNMSFNGKASVDATSGVATTFTIRNYLGRADNAVITITPATNVVKLSKTTFNVTRINATDTVQLNCTLSTVDPTYFRTDSVTCQVVMTSGTYTRYQSIVIPISISTPNSYSKYASTPALTFTGAYAKSPVTFWAVGKSTSGRKMVMHGTAIDSSLTDDLSCITGLSTSSALVGSAQAKVYKTTNSGSLWTNVSVASITAKPLNINMTDASNGVMLGNPTGGKWNVGITSDGGATWTTSKVIGSAQNGETTQYSAICWLNDYCWIGTSTGRVLYSFDHGATWQISTLSGAGNLTQLCFSSKLVGYAISRPTGVVTEAATMYITIDGGVNWAPSGYVFPASGFHPVYAYAPPNSTQCAIVGSLSQVVVTTDTARSFKPLISEDGLTATSGFGYANTTTATLYIIGKTIGKLSFPIVNASGQGVLNVQSTLNFDSVDVGSNQTKSLALQNTGTASLTVNTYALSAGANTTDNDFTLSGSVSQINSGSSSSLFVQFAPQAVGLRSATLSITSTVGNKSVAISGIGRGVSNAVNDNALSASDYLHAYPQPATSHSIVEATVGSGEMIDLNLVDVQGRVVRRIFNGVSPDGYFRAELPTDDLASGLYVCVLRSSHETRRCMIVVQH